MMGAQPKRIAFFLWNVWFFRNFGAVIAELAERGHQVTVVLQRSEAEPSAQRTLERLIARWPNVEARMLGEDVRRLAEAEQEVDAELLR